MSSLDREMPRQESCGQLLNMDVMRNTVVFKYIRTYPLSLTFVVAVLYLSLFRPPKIGFVGIPNADKVIHFGMYLCLSGVIWFEFIRNHVRAQYRTLVQTDIRHAWIGALCCPVLFGGAVELMQEYCVVYRSGDWWDFAANTLGCLVASVIGYRVWCKRLRK